MQQAKVIGVAYAEEVDLGPLDEELGGCGEGGWEVGSRGGVGVGVGYHLVLVGAEDGEGFIFCAVVKEGYAVADSEVITLF
jgi:hypothetical protein